MKKILLYVVSAGVAFTFLKMESGTIQTPVETNQQKNEIQEPRMDSPEMIAEIRREITTPDDLDAPAYEQGYLYRELNKAKKHAAAVHATARTAADENFIERGPANVPGRTRGLIIYPGDATHNTWFAGSAGGGIWKTTDAGSSWTNMTPDFPNLGTTTLAMSESDMNVMYAGTGEGWFASTGMISGMGMFKSLDGGDTWSLLESTSAVRDFGNINRIIVDPSTPDILLVCMNQTIHDAASASSIRRSTDGGATWTVVFDEPGNRVQQLVADPNDFNIQYATVNARGVLKSTDGGQTWVDSSEGLTPGGRVEMAISPVNTNRLYASTQGGLSGVGSDLYTSDDAGATWISVQTAATAIDFLGGQGWYDNGCIAHPYDENTVYVCGVNTFKFTIGTGTVEGNEQVSSVDENGTDAFFDVTNFSAPYFRGGLDVSDNAASRTYVSVELRFGEGRSQMAHRFLVPEGQGSGVADADYEYADYVEVPFEAWDIVNNRQLMVSFRDQQRDGGFDLFHANTDGDASSHSREYIYISEDDYDASGPSSTIAVKGGHVASDLYFLWPILRPDASSDPSTWPTSELVINWSSVTQLEGTTTFMTDAYNDFDGKNTQAIKHPDHHDLVIIIDDDANKEFRIVNGTDGGVFSTPSGTDPGVAQGDWIFTGNGYNTSQFYGADKAPGTDRYIGGMQDNGTWYSPTAPADATTNYTFVIGGDGYESIWHSSDPLKLIGASQFNGHSRSTDGGLTWNAARPGDTGNGNAPFVSRVANSKENPDVLFTVGISGVWRSTDFGAVWNSVPIANDWAFNSTGVQAEVSLANYNVVWAGGAMGEAGKLHVSTDNGVTFNPTQNYPDVTLGTITGMGTHPTDENTFYALFSFAKKPKILKTTDLGQTWTDITGYGTNEVSSTGFPDVVVTSILVMPHDTDRIWAGTEIGIVESLDGGATWALLDSNFPAVSVWQMLVQDDQVVIATHGRGIWSVVVEGLPSVISAPSLREVAESPLEELNLRANFVNDFDQVEILVDGSVANTINDVTAGEQIFSAPTTGFGTKEVQIRATAGSEVRMSNAVSFDFFDVPAAISTYENDFKTQDSDFTASSNAFERNFAVNGFDGGAIHTAHPHFDNINSSYLLVAPLTVASENANFTYDDVAIMELGDEGSVFGEAAFNDYVVVEGTTDGINWIPLETGYDASYNASWTSIIEQGLTPSSDDMITHNIDLLDKFSAGDVVFLRFRVFTDGGGTNWGWAVDNLKIQTGGGTTTGFEDDILNEKQAIRTYPNPVRSRTKIEFFMPHRSNAVIEMVDMNGRLIFEDNLGTRNQGLNSVDWERGNIEQGIYILKLRTIDGVTTTRVQLN